MSRTWSPRGPRAAHPPPHAARRDHVRPGEARPRPATTCGGPRLSCGVPEPRKRGSPPPRSHTPRDADLREAQHTQGPVSTVRAADTPPRAAPPRARRAQLLTSMMQFAASAAAIFTQVLRPPRPPLSSLSPLTGDRLLPEGPPPGPRDPAISLYWPERPSIWKAHTAIGWYARLSSLKCPPLRAFKGPSPPGG